MRRVVMCIAALAASSASLADETPPALVPGLPMRAVTAPAAPAAVTPAPIDVREAEALKALVDVKRGSVDMSVSPPPPRIVAQPGVNEVVPIGINSINRIRTTFARPQVKTVANAEISTEGSMVYVASASPEPVKLFVLDEERPERALSLTLLPRDLPPVDVEIRLAGEDAVQLPVARDAAARWEMEQPYVETIADVMKALSQGEVPQGYGLSQVSAATAAWMPRCDFAGMGITPVQALDGSHLVAVVARVVNRSATVQTLDESRCEADGVLAVAAWPAITLRPGEETELFVVRRRPEATAGARARPSTLGGSR
jgi:conjugal transfer pilus assembly protein TraK